MNITAAFIGGGHMGGALIRGLIARGLAAEKISVGEAVQPRRIQLADELGVHVSADNREALTGADFIFDAALVSRVHCRLSAMPNGELEVRDLDSTNGTYVNGARVDTARLASGDKLRVGRVELVATQEVD